MRDRAELENQLVEDTKRGRVEGARRIGKQISRHRRRSATSAVIDQQIVDFQQKELTVVLVHVVR